MQRKGRNGATLWHYCTYGGVWSEDEIRSVEGPDARRGGPEGTAPSVVGWSETQFNLFNFVTVHITGVAPPFLDSTHPTTRVVPLPWSETFSMALARPSPKSTTV